MKGAVHHVPLDLRGDLGGTPGRWFGIVLAEASNHPRHQTPGGSGAHFHNLAAMVRPGP
jgi:hypothetical protein